MGSRDKTRSCFLASTIVPVSDIVVGDVVCLGIGAVVPADVLILAIYGNFQVNESKLTGESKPVGVEVGGEIQSGGNVVGGKAVGKVVRIGGETAIGKIMKDLGEVETPRSPLQLKLDELGENIVTYSLRLICFMFILEILLGSGSTVPVDSNGSSIPEPLTLKERLVKGMGVSISMAVAAIPEGLPICVAVTLALGVKRMAGMNAIVKRNSCVESLGAVGVVCTDKTGTITKNEMEVTQEFKGEEGKRIGCVCNEVMVAGSGNSTDMAIFRWSNASLTSTSDWTVVSCREFSSVEKWMGVEVRDKEGKYYVMVKGAGERVRVMCEGGGGKGKEEGEWIRWERERGMFGERVISFARTEGRLDRWGDDFLSSPTGLVFGGMVGIKDPPREGVKESVTRLREGGVRVVMITGDGKETATAIAREVGILDSPSGSTQDLEASSHPQILLGSDLDTMSDTTLSLSAPHVLIFARTSPQHKLRIVQALQRCGDIVAMTGDGINDAPALRGADVGVAMGGQGCDVAKEAGDVIVLDDDFSTITAAVREGKGIFYNIRAFLVFQLSTSVGALGLGMLATIRGIPNPMNAMMILFINIVMDGPPAQSLGVEPVSKAVLSAPPRHPDTPIVDRELIKRVLTSGSLIALGTLYVFSANITSGVATRRDTTMSFVTFVNFDLFNAYTCRSDTKTFWEIEPWSNQAFTASVAASFLAQMAIVYFAPAQKVFQTVGLSLGELLTAFVVSSSVLWVDAIRKKLRWRGAWGGKLCKWGARWAGREKKDEEVEGRVMEGERIKGTEWRNSEGKVGTDREGTTRARLSIVNV
ncbi:hypothetical protein TrCOL_g2363 [Triparma columacea]|uniref:Calcium-transporting ATPase n=1 Tax=Triparma columacea TaxID=722753 RepID=A0A9W7LB28_9STRA|nr:hypothetical protein TrCOL_g2363 [Triparma columacea]